MSSSRFRRVAMAIANAVAAVLAAGASGPVQAAGSEAAGPFEFDAFGTLGVVHSSEHRADFNRSALSPKGAGFSDDWSIAVDSLIGGQLRAEGSDRFSGTVQLVSELRHDRTWRPKVEWAYLQWDATPDLSVRVGRTSSPTFAVTDTRRIGYAQHWVRPPSEVYDLIPVTTNDGLDVVWRSRWRGAAHTLQLAAGQSETIASPSGLPPLEALSEQQLIIRYAVEMGPFSAYTNLGRNRLSVSGFEHLFAAFSSFGPEGEAIAARYGALRKVGRFHGVGATWDAGRWFATGEWARIDNPSILGRKSGRYISGGVRLGRFTPYLTLSKLSLDSERSAPGLDLSRVPPPAVPAAAGLNAVLDDVLGSNGQYRTVAGGLRWETSASTALKLQYEHVEGAHGSWGPFTNIQPDFVPGRSARIFSATVSFVL